MPIEIRELIIRAEVAPPDAAPARRPPPQERRSPPAPLTAEEVARILRDLGER